MFLNLKFSLRTLLFLLILFNCKKENNVKNNDDNFSIEINLNEKLDDKKVYLKKQNEGSNLVIDSTLVLNGNALFLGKIEYPEVYGIFLENQSQGIFPIVEKGTIKIIVPNEDLTNTSISGTESNDLLKIYKNNLRTISSKMNNLFHDFQKARAENNSNKISEINKKMELINKEMTNYKIDFIKNNSNSFVASMVLFSLANENMVDKKNVAELYKNLSKEVQQSNFSKKTAEIIASEINKS